MAECLPLKNLLVAGCCTASVVVVIAVFTTDVVVIVGSSRRQRSSRLGYQLHDPSPLEKAPNQRRTSCATRIVLLTRWQQPRKHDCAMELRVTRTATTLQCWQRHSREMVSSHDQVGNVETNEILRV